MSTVSLHTLRTWRRIDQRERRAKDREHNIKTVNLKAYIDDVPALRAYALQLRQRRKTSSPSK